MKGSKWGQNGHLKKKFCGLGHILAQKRGKTDIMGALWKRYTHSKNTNHTKYKFI